jgi:hypothetical protein
MKEDFAYSKQMHYKTVVKPTRMKNLREMSVSIAMIATLEASSKTPEGAVYFLGKLLTLDV